MIFLKKILSGLLAVTVAATLSTAALQTLKVKGTIRGVQADGSKLPLEGAVVTIKGAAMAAKTDLTQTTDGDGNFTFFDLLPGDYFVTVEIPGFEPYGKTYKFVSGAVATLGIDLKIKEASETVEIKADSETIARTESTSQNTLGEKTFRNAPLVNEQFQDALPLLPGVVRGPDGLLNIKGARASQSGLLVNSANVTDPVTGTFAISLPIEAVESVTVLSSPFSAEYGKFSGAVTAIGTRSGGDTWRYLFTNFFPRFRRRNDPVTGKSKIVGLESVTPRFIAAGPIIKGKLTISQSFQYQFVRNRVPALPNLQNDVQLETFDSFTQVDWNVNDRNHLTTVLSFYPQNSLGVNLNTFNPLDVSANFRQRGFFASADERAVFGNGSLLQTTFAFKRFNAFVFPNGDRAMNVAPDGNTGNHFNRQDRYTDRYDAQVVYNFPQLKAVGDHMVKTGVLYSYNTFDGRDRNNRINVANPDGSVNQVIDFLGDGLTKRDVSEFTAYVQDKYTPTPRVTFDAGLRYDRNGISKQNNFAPRFGFVVVPFSDGKTVVRGGIGVFYDKVPLGVGVFDQLQQRRVLGIPGPVFGGPANLVTGSFANTYAGPIRTPYSVAGTVEVDHQITRKLLFRVGWQRREGRNEFIVEPTVDPKHGALMLLSNGGISRYNEVQFTTRYRFTDASDVSFSYVRSRAFGDLNDFGTYFGNFRPPIIRSNERNRLAFDAPNRFLVVGNFELPHGFVASPVLDVHTGFPYSRLDRFQNFVGARNSNDVRLSQFRTLDLQVTKKILIPLRGKKLVTRIGVKIFNLTNSFSPRDAQGNIDSGNLGVFTNSIGRQFRGKFEFDF